MQTSYSIEHVAGYVGGLADSDLSHKIIPLRNNSGADLPHGRGVVHDTGIGISDVSAKLPSAASGEKLLGVSVYSAAKASGPIDSSGVDGIRDDDMFNAISRGAVYVTAEDAQNPTSAVYCRFGPGTAVNASHDAPGVFRTDADVHAAWVKKTAYTLGQRRALAGKVYECITAGTSEDSDTPALSGSTSSDATDGTAHWKYLGICDSTRASAIAVSNARWLSRTTAADALAVLDLNLP